MRDDRVRLGDILEAIERIEKYASPGRDPLYRDELVQTWVVHHLMIVGEACRALSAEFRAAHSEDVWALAGGLRNVIVHEYFGIDLEIVWGVMERDLPALKSSPSRSWRRHEFRSAVAVSTLPPTPCARAWLQLHSSC